MKPLFFQFCAIVFAFSSLAFGKVDLDVSFKELKAGAVEVTIRNIGDEPVMFNDPRFSEYYLFLEKQGETGMLNRQMNFLDDKMEHYWKHVIMLSKKENRDSLDSYPEFKFVISQKIV